MARSPTKIISGKLCLTTTVMSQVLGVEDRTIQVWGEKGCPKAARGWWDIAEVLRWRGLVGTDGVKTEGEAEKISTSGRKLDAEVRLKEFKAEEAGFKNAVNKGEYVRKDEITAELQRFFVVLKRSMTGYSRTIATELSSHVDVLAARRIEKMITELTTDALEQISIDGIYEPSKSSSKKKSKN